MRLIDADEAKKLERIFTLKPSERALFRLMLDRMPTYEPPNPPLTVDELREMDGEPVWDSILGEYCIIDIHAYNGKGTVQYCNKWNNNRMLVDGRFYRRKPEEG